MIDQPRVNFDPTDPTDRPQTHYEALEVVAMNPRHLKVDASVIATATLAICDMINCLIEAIESLEQNR
jgi:hypothetical protein